MKHHIGLISSDWSQCLSPGGPFDPFVFHYPQLEAELDRIFKSYTANQISLGRAASQVKAVLPAMLTAEQMDAYLATRFEIYRGVDKLISWCRKHHILFMINTTGFMGYFQRALANTLLPTVDFLSAHPLLRFSRRSSDPAQMVDLFEIEDKAANTAAMAKKYSIPTEKIVIMGDSGGDGVHFEWGFQKGATLIGSMMKPSLSQYCRDRNIKIDHCFGHTYAEGEAISPAKERRFDFQRLSEIIEPIMVTK